MGMYVQLIDDSSGKTIVAVSSGKVEGKTALERAKATGVAIAKQAIAKKITAAVFDRSGYVYAGKVKAVAEGAREGGLIF
jgi:large subunit ribosomal protein L18